MSPRLRWLLVLAVLVVAPGTVLDEALVDSAGNVRPTSGSALPPPFGGEPCVGTRYCRPSFLIVGAGKAGTSSLYYYLQAHPQVEAAVQKQCQFFDHRWDNGPKWYFTAHFPRSLPPGHITGEASPGYLVYPQVPHRVLSALGHDHARLLVLVREPVDRFWSSFHYNYLKVLKRHARHAAPAGALARAEMALLDQCFDQANYVKGSNSNRQLVDVVGCLNSVPAEHHQQLVVREAAELAEQHSGDASRSMSKMPGIEFPRVNPHLYRQMVARGLYAAMLEHWYAVFPDQHFHVVCTESLRDEPVAALDRVAAFLGLERFDFTTAVARGKYNSRAHRGYDVATSWEEAAAAEAATPPIDEALRQQLHAYYAPFNSRLFELTGVACSW